MRRWIIFRAEPKQPGWKDRRYSHTHSLTRMLREEFHSTDSPMPKVGDRFIEFVRVEDDFDSSRHVHNTHSKVGDWEVVRVEAFTPNIPRELTGGDFDEIIVCHCRHNPINAPLKELPDRAPVSVASFSGDEQAFKKWQESQKQ